MKGKKCRICSTATCLLLSSIIGKSMESEYSYISYANVGQESRSSGKIYDDELCVFRAKEEEGDDDDKKSNIMPWAKLSLQLI